MSRNMNLFLLIAT